MAERFTRTTQNRMGAIPCGFESHLAHMNRNLLAYMIGVAIGDGNLSNPNGRATRLRITCDAEYPKLAEKIKNSIKSLLPNNKVSVIYRHKNYFDISCYSNRWEEILRWHVGKGSKIAQNVSIPNWINGKATYKINCLRGLLETDGSIYNDRGYRMVMFTTAIPKLARDVYDIIKSLGFTSHIYKIDRKNNSYNFKQKPIYHIRVSKNVERFLNLIKPEKI